jgi:hypothetical protein
MTGLRLGLVKAVRVRAWFGVLGLALLGACATKPPPLDYTAFRAAKPQTLLVLPPLNQSPDIKATPSVWAHATLPLSEAGYYVLPVALVDQTFKQNGITTAHGAHEIPTQKLRDVFGADAAVYIKVTEYGSSYAIVASETKVVVEARIVDLRTGALLWQGAARASSAEQGQQNQGGLIGLLVAAAVKQVLSSTTDLAFNFSGTASQRLLGAPRYNGVLPGPRSPAYGQPMPAQ